MTGAREQAERVFKGLRKLGYTVVACDGASRVSSIGDMESAANEAIAAAIKPEIEKASDSAYAILEAGIEEHNAMQARAEKAEARVRELEEGGRAAVEAWRINVRAGRPSLQQVAMFNLANTLGMSDD